jgi:hypothetical protein
MAMTGVSELDRIFSTVSVCRSFRLNGLQEILKRTKLNIKPVTLIWQVGDLSARGYFDTSVVNFVVNPDKAKEALSTLKDISPFEPLELHEEWREWYQEEFRRYFKADDLAELLFHEAASFEKHKEEVEGKFEYLKNKTLGYLRDYYDNIVEKQNLDLKKSSDIKETAELKQAFGDLVSGLKEERKLEKAQEVTEYISNLRHYIEDEVLNRFDEILSSSEYEAFIEFLDSLNP